MITTRMSVREITEEFRKDHESTIRGRIFGYLEANRKIIQKNQKLLEKTSKEKETWVKCAGVRKIKTPKNNYYRVSLKSRINKEGQLGYLSTIYTILNDSITGRKMVYVMPASETDKGLIVFSSKFFSEFNDYYKLNPETFEESVDNFMKLEGKKFDLYTQETENPRYNCQVDLGNGMVGFGLLEKEKAIFTIRHFRRTEDLLREAEKLGLETRDPLKIYLHGKEEKDMFDIAETRIKSEKEKEIEAAWEEYKKLELL